MKWARLAYYRYSPETFASYQFLASKASHFGYCLSLLFAKELDIALLQLAQAHLVHYMTENEVVWRTRRNGCQI